MARPKRVVPGIDVQDAIRRIECGETQREIASSIGVSVGSLNAALNADGVREQSARAMLLSAEAWLDRGLSVLADALRRDSGLDASAARAYAQECARRAAIRNPKYREKQDVTVAGDASAPIVHVIERRLVKPVDNSGGNL